MMFNKSNQPVTFEGLTEEYQAKLTEFGLPQLSADELLHEELTDEQRRYVSDFYNRWTALEEEERAFAEAEREAFNRPNYEGMTEQELRSRLASVRDRMARADTTEAALADAYTEQEICSAMSAKGFHTNTGHGGAR